MATEPTKGKKRRKRGEIIDLSTPEGRAKALKMVEGMPQRRVKPPVPKGLEGVILSDLVIAMKYE